MAIVPRHTRATYRNPSPPAPLPDRSKLPKTGADMTEFLGQVLIPILLASVAAVLILGLINMMRGGNPWRSQYLMQARVVLQFVTIVIVMLTIWSMMGR